MGIIRITKGTIKLQVGDRAVTVDGEAYARGYGNPDFVVYADSIRNWDQPNDRVAIDEKEKKEILDLIKSEMHKRNMTVEVE
jgi:hypothetical protein